MLAREVFASSRVACGRGLLRLFAFCAVALPQSSWSGDAQPTPIKSKECTPQFAPLRDTSTSGSASRLPLWLEDSASPWRGTGWLGWKAGGVALSRVQLTIRDVIDPNGVSRWLTVRSTPPVDFAVRCVSGLKTGSIRNSLVEPVDLLGHGPLTVSLGNRQYTVSVQASGKELRDARVVLTQGGRSQTLYSVGEMVDEPHFSVVWAGDIDQDGELDLVVDLNEKYSWHPYRLLLSSKAKGSEMVGEAAEFVSAD